MSTPPSPTAAPAAIRVPAGTTAQQALKDAGVPLKGPDGAVVVRDVATGDLKDLDLDPGRRRRGRAGARPPAPTAARSSGTRPRTCWPRPCRSSSPAPGSASGRRSRTASTTTSTPSGPSPPRTCTALEKKMSEIVRAGQRFSRREISDADAQAELAHEPYKLELIGLKGGGGRRPRAPTSRSAARS